MFQVPKLDYVGEWGCQNAKFLDLGGQLAVGGLLAGGVIKLAGALAPHIARLSMGGVSVGPYLLKILQAGGVGAMTYLGYKGAQYTADQILMLATGDVEERVKKGSVFVTVTRPATQEEMELAVVSLLGGIAAGALTGRVMGRKGLPTAGKHGPGVPKATARRGRGTASRAAHTSGGAKLTDASRAHLERELGVPIVENPSIGNAVRIHYSHNPRTWKVQITHIEAGSHATVGRVRVHKLAMKRMRRYNGLVGKLKRLWDKARRRGNPFDPSTREWKSWHEVEKLNDVILESRNRLADATDPGAVQREIRILRRARRRHARIVHRARSTGRHHGTKSRFVGSPATDRRGSGERRSSRSSSTSKPSTRLPQDGRWTGEPGESTFIPNKASKLPHPHDRKVVDLKPGEGIPFKNGRPDFSKHAVDEFDVPGLDGSNKDRNRMALALAKRYRLLGKTGKPTVVEGVKWMKQYGLSPHHAGGTKVQLIPHGVHGVPSTPTTSGRVGIPHAGGASDLRKQHDTKR